MPEGEYTAVYNFEVADFHTYYVSDFDVLVHNDCKVDYGSTDLSKEAIKYRKANKLTSGRNVAVFEYMDGDELKTITRSSANHRYAERIIGDELKSRGIKSSNVTRIYSELQPCTTRNGSCRKFISENYPDAKVSYSFEYGSTKQSRRRGVYALKKAVKKL